MQVNRAELQKVRVKLSRDALTIQKEGGSGIPSSSRVSQVGWAYFYLCAFLRQYLVLMFFVCIFLSKLLCSFGKFNEKRARIMV